MYHLYQIARGDYYRIAHVGMNKISSIVHINQICGYGELIIWKLLGLHTEYYDRFYTENYNTRFDAVYVEGRLHDRVFSSNNIKDLVFYLEKLKVGTELSL